MARVAGVTMEIEHMVGMNDDEFLTRTEAAALVRLNPRTLGNLAAKKPPQGPPYMKTARLRGKTLYRRSALIAWLEGNGCGHTESAVQPADHRAKPRRRKAATT
jgi:hypothetical protein